MISLETRVLRFALFLAAAGCIAAYMAGRHDGRALCVANQAADRENAHLAALERARANTQRATSTGTAREADRARLDHFFDRLAEDARHDPPDPVDACVLPPDRLRRWADANAGRADQGAAPGQPDGAASAAAATGFWARARLGSQPPAGSPRLSPAGQPDVPASAVPGGSP